MDTYEMIFLGNIFALQELQFQDAKQCAEATFKQRCLSVETAGFGAWKWVNMTDLPIIYNVY